MSNDTELQLEIYTDGAWISVATILPQGDTSRGEGCPTEVAYDLDYASEHFGSLHARALSVRFPVAYEPLLLPHCILSSRSFSARWSSQIHRAIL